MIQGTAIWFVSVIPLASSLIILLICLRLGRRSGAFLRDAGRWGGGAALALAYAPAHWWIHGPPNFAPELAQHVPLWAAALGAGIGVVGVWTTPRAIWTGLGRFLAALGIVWLTMRWKMTLGQWSVVELGAWSCAIATMLTITWGSMRELGRWAPTEENASGSPFAALFAMSIMVFAASVLIGAQARSNSGSMTAMALAAALLGAALAALAFRTRSGELLRGAAPVVTLVLGSLLIDAVLRSPLHEGYAVLVMVTPTLLVGARGLMAPCQSTIVGRLGTAFVGLTPLLFVTLIEVVRFVNDESAMGELGW